MIAHRWLRRVSIALLAAVAANCAPSSYEGNPFVAEPQANSLGNNSYEIIASADTFANEVIVEEYGLLKAAETTVANGKDAFRIVNANLERLNPNRRHSRLGLGYRITLIIETASNEDLPDSADDYRDAQDLLQTLGAKYKD